MARNKGTAIFAVNFEPTGQSPLDARLQVNTKSDLYTAYSSNNYYPDMVVTVKDEHAQYILIDVERIGEDAGWKRIDGGEAMDSLTWVDVE